jgi:hypothetical protein
MYIDEINNHIKENKDNIYWITFFYTEHKLHYFGSTKIDYKFDREYTANRKNTPYRYPTWQNIPNGFHVFKDKDDARIYGLTHLTPHCRMTVRVRCSDLLCSGHHRFYRGNGTHRNAPVLIFKKITILDIEPESWEWMDD